MSLTQPRWGPLALVAVLLLGIRLQVYAQPTPAPQIGVSATYETPKNLNELWSRAEAVVLVRIVGSRPDTTPPAYGRSTAPRGRPQPSTVHDVLVLDVLKDQSTTLTANGKVKVRQKAGVINVDGSQVHLPETPYSPGAMYVLFLLARPDGAYIPNWGPYAAFEVKDGKIVHAMLKSADGLALDSLLALLRSMR